MSRSTRSRWRVVAAVVAIGLVAAACGSDKKDDDASNGGSDNTSSAKYSIAFVGPKTGGDKNLGLNILYGAQLAVKQFNAANPDLQVKLKEFDTQGDPKQADGQFAKYNADSSILGLVGPAFSGETEAVLPKLQEAKLPMISSSATRVSLATIVGAGNVAKTAEGYSVFHRALPDDNAQAAGIAKYVVSKYAGKSIFYADDAQAYSTGLVQELQKAAQGKNADKGHFGFANKDDTTGIPNAVTAVAGAKPDIVFYGGYYPLAGRFKKALGDNDATKNVIFISGDGSLDQGFLDGASPNADGSVIACPCNLATAASPGKLGEFAKAYTKEFGQDPGTYSSEAFDAANILLDGIKAGNTTREKLLAYVEGVTSYAGISKQLDFEENGNIKATTVYFFEVKNGKFVPAGDTSSL